jgi:DNA modification methylase
MIVKKDSLAFLKEQKDFAFDINYSDPPYALGSEIIIRPDGKYDYKKATDFMNKWEMPTGEYWESWFEESFRTLKHGGYCIMYGMDRQLPMFQYYAIKSGFQVRQSMYWYFISSFPKATDLSKMIDKNANVEREVVGKKVRGDVQKAKEKGVGFLGDYANRNNVKQFGYGVEDLTLPTTELAKKYDGYKYSIAPLKQTCETIMIFQKPYKTGSCMHDVLAYENGDDTCGCFALNIDSGRVPMSENDNNMLNAKSSKNPTNNYNGKDHQKYGDFALNIATPPNEEGRYPSQTFCDSEVAKILDEQSGVFTSSKSNKVYDNNAENRNVKNSASGQRKPESTYGDTGGCSKILHKCDYENDEMDLYVYEPKVSKSERNAGCEELEEKNNTHPTLKPISLSYRILKLFKSPNEQKIIYPFAGVQSEVIGGYKAGFIDYVGCELSEEYVNIGNARFEHWKNKPFDKKGKLEKTKDVKKSNEQLNLF